MVLHGASESAEVELPAVAVVIALVVAGLAASGQVVVAQHDACPAVLRVQGDDDAGVAGRGGGSFDQPHVNARRELRP